MKPRTLEQTEQGEFLLPTSEKGAELVHERRERTSKWQWISTTCVVAASLVVGYIAGFGSAKSTSTAQYGLPSKHVCFFV